MSALNPLGMNHSILRAFVRGFALFLCRYGWCKSVRTYAPGASVSNLALVAAGLLYVDACASLALWVDVCSILVIIASQMFFVSSRRDCAVYFPAASYDSQTLNG
jgi:hypothetical protein